MVLLEHRAAGPRPWKMVVCCLAKEDRAAHVGASRSPQEVMEHHVSMYIHGNPGKACIPSTIPNR